MTDIHMEVVDVSDDDNASTGEDIADLSPDRCRECGDATVAYSGRGPRPKYCAAHKRGGRGATSDSGSPRSARWKEPLKNALLSNFAMVGTVVYSFDKFDGQAIIAGADGLASSLVEVAEKNHKVRKALEAVTTGSAWAGVAIAVGSIAIPILAHHGFLPGSLGAPVTGS